MEKITFVNRKGTDCYKWDHIEERYASGNPIPLTVADMDFKCPSCVQAALRSYVDMGAIGYGMPSDDYYKNFIEWERKYHNNRIQKEWIRYAPGVVVAIAWLLEELFETGDSCIILSPVYGPFFHTPKRSGLNVVTSGLINKKGEYTIDFEDFEKKIIENNVKVFLLCSPHNPVGRVWKQCELEHLVAICKKHSVFIISDEIHHDILLFGNEHIPILSIGDYQENMAMLTSPAKSFNLAGVENSFMILPGEKVREKIDIMQDRIATHSGNVLGNVAAAAAYGSGREWLESLCTVIEENYQFAKETLQKAFPMAEISPLEGTFLMWVNFEKYLASDENARELLAEKANVILGNGTDFGGEAYQSFARFNLATSKELIEEALNRIIIYLQRK